MAPDLIEEYEALLEINEDSLPPYQPYWDPVEFMSKNP